MNTVELNPRLKASIVQISLFPAAHRGPSMKGKVIQVLQFLRGPSHNHQDVVPTESFQQLRDTEPTKTNT
jgi:hypothetical protein